MPEPATASVHLKSESTEQEMQKPATFATETEHLETQRASSTATPKKTYLQQLKLYSGTPNEGIFGIIIRPFFMIAYPAVIWAIISYSISLACVVTVNSLNAFVLQAPPYNLSPGINGLVNIPALLGTLSGAFTGGYLTDVYSTWDARRHGGVFSPESRLPLLVIPGLLVPTGMLMFGFGATRHLHWAVLFVANGFINVGVTAVASIGMIYVSDSYFPVAHEALLLINGLKNVVAFGYTYGVTPWVVSAGFEKPFGTIAGIFMAIILSSSILYFFGKTFRRASAQWKVVCW
ncbi:hypothetical protein H2200_009526 [Cladophialophora chaetospira]|uniref:Uncharacterized protein n=1 Tax=Cladophialophora chaetospira TaxID=386627 RepID=A0AA39CEY6_9EURO|nr:hypothetical protein H2200_009526 [Cladophialophora chaetospira]